MNDDDQEPFIGPDDQALFDIEDTRERADQLKRQLTPKIEYLLDEACSLVEEVYGPDAMSPYRISLTPAHRSSARKTEEFETASAGLVIKGKGHHWYFQQRIQCHRDLMFVELFGCRGREANPIALILQRYESEATQLLDYFGFWLNSRQVPSDHDEESPTIKEVIQGLSPHSERDWRAYTAIGAAAHLLPLESSLTTIPYEFVGMFPIFRAATDILLGLDDQFLRYAKQFWEWDATVQEAEDEETTDTHTESQITDGRHNDPEDDDFATEGDFRLALKKHYIRERRLRRKKIRHALKAGDGHLRCEVPGCGFDFFDVYGEIGQEFAIVHHTKPVGGRAKPEPTRMDELAIVCANCHAMIHRGNKCRLMREVAPLRIRSIP